MNRLFNMTTNYQRVYWTTFVGRYLSLQGAQAQLARDLDARE